MTKEELAFGASLEREVRSSSAQYFASNPEKLVLFGDVLCGRGEVDGSALVTEFFDPMVDWLYKEIRRSVDAENLSESAASIFICELSFFARYNAQFLKRASRSVSGFCPEFEHELMRNHLEEGGDKGRLPAHFILYTGALIRDLGLVVNGYVPKFDSTRTLVWLHDCIVESHCPSTILGMYYATEAVAIDETLELQRITDRLGIIRGRSKSERLDLNYYFDLHLSDSHIAANEGVAVERGHQDGIGGFIRSYAKYGFNPAQIVDGFLQMIGPLADQWFEIAEAAASSCKR